MIGFDTPIPGFIPAALAAVCALLLAWSWKLHHRDLRPGYLAAVLSLRLLALAAVLVLLLQPYTTIRQPDPGRFQVAVLVDASASMRTADAGGISRAQRAQMLLGPEAPPAWHAFHREYAPRIYAFAEDIRLLPAGQAPTPMPGQTALGDTLLAAGDAFKSANLAGLLVLSDGNSNRGAAPAEAAKVLRGRGIPVSVLGIGSPQAFGDLAVSFSATDGRVKGVKGRELRLRCRVENSFSRDQQTSLALAVGGAVMDERELLVPAGGHADVEFSLAPRQAGMQTCAVRLRPPPEDEHPDTDVDFLALEVAEPDRFRILYLGAALNWEYKHLKQVVDDTPQLSLAALIRSADSAFFTAELPAFAKPEAALEEIFRRLPEFDAVLLDARLLAQCPPEAVSTLLGFVENRGGGLLVFGPSALVPPELWRALPVLPVAADTLPGRVGLAPRNLEMLPNPPPLDLDAPPGLFLRRGDQAQLFPPPRLKRGATTLLAAGGEAAVLALQFYGSGRSAYIGTEQTWRWRLAGNAGASVHQWFWRNLIVWLGSASRERLTSATAGSKVAVGSAMELDLQVLDAQFLPAANAEAVCQVVAPGLPPRELRLTQTPEAEGKFATLFTPEQPGEYRLLFAAGTGGDKLLLETAFLARHESIETRRPEYREDVLRDLARITGGKFWRHDQPEAPAGLPLRPGMPEKISRRYWTDLPVFLPLLLLWLAGEWYLRRRVGLK